MGKENLHIAPILSFLKSPVCFPLCQFSLYFLIVYKELLSTTRGILPVQEMETYRQQVVNLCPWIVTNGIQAYFVDIKQHIDLKESSFTFAFSLSFEGCQNLR